MGIAEDDIYKYLVSADHSTSPLGGSVHENWNGISVECYFDPEDNFAVVWVPECRTSVYFRPYNYSRDNPVQAFKPGIVIQAPDTATVPRRVGGFPGSLCARPQDDPDIFTDLVRSHRLRGPSTALTYEMLIVRVDQSGGEYDLECSLAQEVISHCYNREEAINACNRIFTHKPTFSCLVKYGVNVMLTFTDCLLYFCFGEAEPCRVFTTNLNKCSKTHRFLSDIECPQV
ncbi:uncharacterized protein LOC143280531 [Babylonia areolata]|uniref:uncharacterized protein LOC143280531 n=1 Tax=Babylonia areolata TaxID=304850 RepID=UPI003FD4A837